MDVGDLVRAAFAPGIPWRRAMTRSARRAGVTENPSTEEIVAALRQSVLDNERLREDNELAIAAANEPVAIVGMACRFPGGVARRRICGGWSARAATRSGVSRRTAAGTPRRLPAGSGSARDELLPAGRVPVRSG